LRPGRRRPSAWPHRRPRRWLFPSSRPTPRRQRLPAVYGARYFVQDGGLLSYGVDGAKQFIRAADYVARILGGTKPAGLPVEQPTKFELVVNLGVARSQGIRVPKSVLFQATEVIR